MKKNAPLAAEPPRSCRSLIQARAAAPAQSAQIIRPSRFALDWRHRGETSGDRFAFQYARRTERLYAGQLRGVADVIGRIVDQSGVVQPGGLLDRDALPALAKALSDYADLITPWGKSVSQRMIADTMRRDDRAWKVISRRLGRALHEEIQSAPTGAAMRDLMAEQIHLIRSLPIEASERVHKLVIEGLSNGDRYSEVIKEIERSGEVTRSRAMLIARTETGRAAGSLVEARSRWIGSEGYIWRTAHDADVRKEHKRLEGTFHRWDDPPVAGTKGMRYHAGRGPNCRCWPEPLVPSIIE